MARGVEEYPLSYGQGIKIHMTYVLENKPKFTFLVIGDRLVLCHSNTYRKLFPRRNLLEPVGDCHSRIANKPAA